MSPRHRMSLDTNVLVSAVLFGGVPGEIVEAARSGEVAGVVSLHILGEFVDVVTRPRFGFDEDVALALAEEIASFCEVIPVESSAGSWVSDPADNPVVEAALIGGVTHIVTGDSRLLQVELEGISILPPADALTLLRK